MARKDEVRKAKDRKQELTDAELALEDAREAHHANRKDPETRAAFKQAQEAVRAERLAHRQAREAAGPPSDATNVQRDAAGRVVGWNTPAGDAVAMPGGTA